MMKGSINMREKEKKSASFKLRTNEITSVFSAVYITIYKSTVPRF